MRPLATFALAACAGCAAHIYECGERAWRLVHEFGGFRYEIEPDPVSPEIVAIDRINRETIRQTVERWNAGSFHVTERRELGDPAE